ncbi:MAG: hypothetical protein D6775_09040 [Caldilineae bacterium]|nr:MAG: hypothetical protein D6775_09040 [Caldilineae bacterium]
MGLKRVGLLVALAALLVNAPRLMLIYLRVDGLALPAQIEGAMLALTGIATGIVLTGGGMYIAHVLARPAGTGGFARALLGLCWVLLLAFAVVLVSPALVAGIRATDMAGVLTTTRWQWVWAVTAVAAVEILAAGAMVAHALAGEPAQARGRPRASGPGALGLLADAAARRLAASIEPQPGRGAPASPTAPLPAQADPELAGMPVQSNGTAGTVPCPQADLGCDYVGTQAGVNAHQRFCEYRRNGQRAKPLPTGGRGR